MTPVRENEELELPDEEADLLAYLDGELEGDRAAAIEARLRTDRAFAARVRALSAIGDFLRSDADRIYRDAKVDSIVDDVLARVRSGESAPDVERVPETNRPAEMIAANDAPNERPRLREVLDVAPPTSRLARSRRGTVVWVTFGVVAAAAAALVLFVRTAGGPGPAPVASTTPTASVTDKVAVVKTAPIPTSHPTETPPIPEHAQAVQVDDLEVGQGATVIYARDTQESPPVVWINAREREGAK